MFINSKIFRIQFWKTRESVEKDDGSLAQGVTSPKKERKSETLVNRLLIQQAIKKTETEDIPPPLPLTTPPSQVPSSGCQSADDTISIFDELFTAVCPDTINLDEHIETNFNMIYEEKEKEDRRMSEESVGEVGENLVSSLEVDIEPLHEGNHEAKETICTGQEEEEATPSKDTSYVNSIVESIEKVSKTSEFEGSISRTSSPNSSSDVDKSTVLCSSLEKVEGKYKCDDCGKDFKFLTYLKGHKSKSGCINSNGKKKRPSMNFSKIVY